MAEKMDFRKEEAMTNTITYEGRTFTLDEDYEHPRCGRVKFVGLYVGRSGYFRYKNGELVAIRYDSFSLPEPEPEPETVLVRIPTVNSTYPFRFTHDEARAAIKALQDALGETS